MANIFVVLVIAATIAATSANRVCHCRNHDDDYRYTDMDREERWEESLGLEKAILSLGYSRTYLMSGISVAKEPRVNHYRSEVITEKEDSVVILYQRNVLSDGSVGEIHHVDKYVVNWIRAKMDETTVLVLVMVSFIAVASSPEPAGRWLEIKRPYPEPVIGLLKEAVKLGTYGERKVSSVHSLFQQTRYGPETPEKMVKITYAATVLQDDESVSVVRLSVAPEKSNVPVDISVDIVDPTKGYWEDETTQ